MARSPVGDQSSDGGAGGNLKKGPWTLEEDRKLMEYVEKHGRGSWQRIPKLAGLNRCGKSCRLRWTNYLRPDIKRGKFTEEEEQLIIHLHSLLGNRWSSIATKLPGRTDNEIKNYWNTHLRKKLLRMGIDPVTHRPTTAATNLNLLAGLLSCPSANLGAAAAAATHLDAAIKLQADLAHLLKLQLVQSLFQVLASTDSGSSSNPAPPPPIPNMNLLSLLGTELRTPNPATNSVPTVQNLSILGQILNENNIDFSMNSEELVTASDASRSEEASMEISNVSSTSSYFPASNSTPLLVSSEAKSVDPAKSNTSCMQADESLASTSFDGWENLKLDNLDSNDFGWKDIIDQMSWSDEP